MLQYRYHGREKRKSGRFKFLANNLPGSCRNHIYPADLYLDRKWGWSGKYLPVCRVINRSADPAGFVFLFNNSRNSKRFCCFVSQDDSRVTPNHQQDSGISR